MEFKTIYQWDEKLWTEVGPIYLQAFAEKGAKPEKIIRNMFRKQICFLHFGIAEDEIVSMALTGKMEGTSCLLIDYLAVHEKWQKLGLGMKLLEYIQEWSLYEGGCDSLIIEVESDETRENLARINFWKKCGFKLTDYIHHYIWVPEPYQAMYLKLQTDAILPEDGKDLFKNIGQFHKESYQGS